MVNTQKPNSHNERQNKTQINWELIEEIKRLANNNKRKQDWGFPPVKADGSPSNKRDDGYLKVIEKYRVLREESGASHQHIIISFSLKLL